MTGYSLWTEPWIPVTLLTGEPKRVSIRDALVEASSIRGVLDSSPLITVAVHRLLLAVLYRVFRPQSKQDWAGLWRSGGFDAGRLDGYGAVRADRFDLFHPAHPFYQVPLIPDETMHPVSALVLEAASGNNPTLFDHGLAEGAEALPPDRAACHLLAHQLFAVGGGNSKPFNRMDGPLTKGLVVEAQGSNLFETLLLNLMPLEYWNRLIPNSDQDKPFWELGSAPAPLKKGTDPLGPLHYLTWQSRQIHLVANDPEGMVSGCQIRQRFCLPKDGQRRDPGKPYRQKKKEGWVPLRISKQRAVWQFTHVLLQATEEDMARPYLMDWLAVANEMGLHEGLGVPPVIGIAVSALGTHPKDAAKVELWRREVLPVPTSFVENPDLVGELAELLKRARSVERLLEQTAVGLVWALGEARDLQTARAYVRTGKLEKGKKVPAGYVSLAPSLELVTRFWPALEKSFRNVLRDLPGPDLEGVRKRWVDDVRRAAEQAFRAARDTLLHAVTRYEVLTQIEDAFGGRLSWILTSKEATKNDAESDD